MIKLNEAQRPEWDNLSNSKKASFISLPLAPQMPVPLSPQLQQCFLVRSNAWHPLAIAVDNMLTKRRNLVHQQSTIQKWGGGLYFHCHQLVIRSLIRANWSHDTHIGCLWPQLLLLTMDVLRKLFSSNARKGNLGSIKEVMYGCESWTIKKAEHRRIDAFELWCWRRLTVPWSTRRSNQSILKKSVLNSQWKDRCWSWNSNTLATWYEELTPWKRPWCWERLKAGEGSNTWWDGWMASLTRCTWVWESSRSWWWTGKPGLLQSTESQRVGHVWET